MNIFFSFTNFKDTMADNITSQEFKFFFVYTMNEILEDIYDILGMYAQCSS